MNAFRLKFINNFFHRQYQVEQLKQQSNDQQNDLNGKGNKGVIQFQGNQQQQRLPSSQQGKRNEKQLYKKSSRNSPVKSESNTLNLQQLSSIDKNFKINIHSSNQLDFLKDEWVFQSEPGDQKWSEYKIVGSNIQTRSYSSMTILNDELYVYGGYELNQGILKDFWKINLKKQQFVWEKVKQTNSKQGPGPRCRHTCVSHGEKIYIIGGQYKNQLSTNSIHSFDTKRNEWQLIQATGAVPDPFDSHSCVQKGNTIYLICGYNVFDGKYQNSVYKFDLLSHKFDCLISSNSQNPLKGRICTASALDSSNIYIFGGYDGQKRLNDLWKFDLSTNQWSQIVPKSFVLPQIRSGSQMVCYQNKLFLFGGIHEVTHELDDLYCFDIKTGIWTELDKDSLSKGKVKQFKKSIQQQQPFTQSNQYQQPFTQSNQFQQPYYQSPQQQQEAKTPVDSNHNQGNQNMVFSNYTNNMNRNSFKKNNRSLPPVQRHKGSLKEYGYTGYSINQQHEHSDSEQNSNYYKEYGTTQSPTKNLIEKRKREFLHRKASMLAQLEVKLENNPNPLKIIDLNLSPTSEAMVNSLEIMDMLNPKYKVKNNRLSEFGKTTVSRFMEPLQDSSSQKTGKRPCARDGHSSCIQNGEFLIIFGGDRHKMSFNDIYALNLKAALDEFSKLQN